MKPMNFNPKRVTLMKFIKANSSKALAVALLMCIAFSILHRNSVVKKAEDSPETLIRQKEDFLEPLISYEINSQKTTPLKNGSKDTFNRKKEVEDTLFGGLVNSDIDKNQCLSKYQSSLYRRPSPHKPSSYLISKLRNYEKLHAQCGPGTESYNKTAQLLKSGQNIHEITRCKYVVWSPYSGLGNTILTISSAFLYALLTNRVLLVDPGTEIDTLFCEPFPGTSWLLPDDFPAIQILWELNQKSPECFWNVLTNNNTKFSANAPPPFMYIHLVHDYDDNNKLFLCDQYQDSIIKVPWLNIASDNYFIPSLFTMASFEQELSKMFPDKETVFHHIVRYLFHPTNNAWGLITRYYDTYLANADEKIGIQVRTFATGNDVYQYAMDQILACAFKEKLLPQLNFKEFGTMENDFLNKKLTAVLMTSLSSNYSETMRDMYLSHPTMDGANVAIYQPSHEEFQKTGQRLHDIKAWSEMYLLSMCDTLVISSWSTFGYIAQGLGGMKPWILRMPSANMTMTPPAGPACIRAMSMEPCFHAPPQLDCKTRTWTDSASLIPYIRHCEDMLGGIKLVNG